MNRTHAEVKGAPVILENAHFSRSAPNPKTYLERKTRVVHPMNDPMSYLNRCTGHTTRNILKINNEPRHSQIV